MMTAGRRCRGRLTWQQHTQWRRLRSGQLPAGCTTVWLHTSLVSAAWESVTTRTYCSLAHVCPALIPQQVTRNDLPAAKSSVGMSLVC